MSRPRHHKLQAEEPESITPVVQAGEIEPVVQAVMAEQASSGSAPSTVIVVMGASVSRLAVELARKPWRAAFACVVVRLSGCSYIHMMLYPRVTKRAQPFTIAPSLS